MSKDIIEVVKNAEGFRPGESVTLEQVEQAQKELGVKFADDYIKYLLEFGNAFLISVDLLGIEDDPKFKYASVVYETLEEKECDPTAPADMYVIENLGIDGVLAWQHESGVVYYKYRYDEELQKAADSLAEYVENSFER